MASDGESEVLTRWAASGLMALTGRSDGPALGPPAGLVKGVDEWATRFPGLDPLALLAERAAGAGLRRQGTVSCGGAARLLRTVDGWLAVSLARPDDVELLPAWLDVEPTALGAHGDEPPWEAIEAHVATRRAQELDERATLFGLPVGWLGGASEIEPVTATGLGAAPARSLAGALVVDLTSLWAGPLCGALLAERGAEVIKVESTTRPDGARYGDAAFFDRLNGAKRSVALDFTDPDALALLASLVARADVVLEASRPRALRQLGIVAEEYIARGPQVWLSITGHGRTADPARVAFGDDAAVAGGLVVHDDVGPVFCADAVADPCSGLAAAAAVVDALEGGGRWLLDVSMVGVASKLAGPTLVVGPDLVAAEPSGLVPVASAPELGADTGAVVDWLRSGHR